MTQTLPAAIVIHADEADAPLISVTVPGTAAEIEQAQRDQIRRCRLAQVWAAVSDDDAF